MSNWCDVKMAYLLEPSTFPKLSKAVADDSIFDLMVDDQLPPGWEFRGTDISGASGFVLIFEIVTLPTYEATEVVDRYLRTTEWGL